MGFLVAQDPVSALDSDESFDKRIAPNKHESAIGLNGVGREEVAFTLSDDGDVLIGCTVSLPSRHNYAGLRKTEPNCT
jgi:hypothetical protein